MGITARILLATTFLVAAIPAVPFLRRRLTRPLRPGDRVRISGGYEEPAPWLGRRPACFGTVDSFLAASAGATSAVVRLDEPLTVSEKSGDILVLTLRFRGARWGASEIVHVELCDSVPDGPAQRRGCTRVESHASYQRIGARGGR